MSGNKPSYTEQRRNQPRTDRKLRAEDRHLVAQDKEEVAGPHGDKLKPLTERHPRKAGHREPDVRDAA